MELAGQELNLHLEIGEPTGSRLGDRQPMLKLE
jgi:hypothetical protein